MTVPAEAAGFRSNIACSVGSDIAQKVRTNRPTALSVLEEMLGCLACTHGALTATSGWGAWLSLGIRRYLNPLRDDGGDNDKA